MGDNVTLSNGDLAAADEVNIGGTLVKVQRNKLGHGADGSYTEVSTASPYPVALYQGTYGYAAGTTPTTVDVPSGARVRRVSVLAGASAATLTIAGGVTITVPANQGFDEQIPGEATLGGDVVIGGTVASYYVAWTT